MTLNWSTIRKIGIALTATGIIAMGIWKEEESVKNLRYDYLTKDQKVAVDSLRKVGIPEEIIYDNVQKMCNVMGLLKDAKAILDKQEKFEKEVRATNSPEIAAYLIQEKLSAAIDNLRQAEINLSQIDPKIFPKREFESQLKEYKHIIAQQLEK